ncbi:MAG: ABC transporter permease [Pirellulales bacterium]|nr:ABC transporter permease [Pirellulales bacterium]
MILVVTVVGWVLSAIRYGPVTATSRCFSTLRNGASDLVFLSPRRVGALAGLAIKESLRRWVLVAGGIFGLMILFAGWFLDPGSPNPAYLYLNFVLTSTSYLMLILVWLLSAMSLPVDFSNHTIQTLVTKPVRSSEIVLGRILGFTAVSTVLLVLMGVVSYFFVIRGLAHTHELPPLEKMQDVAGALPGQPPAKSGKTSTVQDHFHTVAVEPSGAIELQTAHGHTHRIETLEKDGNVTYKLGGAEGWLQARVPVYGQLRFLDRLGRPTPRGVNVGWEWDYKSFIQGGSSAAAIWTMDGITPERFPEGLLVEMDLSVFRSYKGQIERGIPGSLTLRNPKTKLYLELPVFEAKEYRMTRLHVPRRLETPEGKMVDLFRDLTDDGALEIQLRCEEPNQYFGVARNSLYLRARDASFVLNFAKGYLGIWMQMVLVITLGVFFSTFLSAPVALVSTLGVIIGGFAHQFLADLAAKKTYGGGPFESIYRILTQDNMTVELGPGLIVSVVKALDVVAAELMKVLAGVLPDFSRFDFTDYVANGFDIPGTLIAKYLCRTAAFVLPVFVAAYFCLKGRETAK